MKILHVTPAFHPATAYGGPITSLLGLCRALAAEGCEVLVLTTDANGPTRLPDVETGRPVELAPRLRVRYCRRLAREAVAAGLLRSLWPCARWADVVHLTGAYSFPTIPTLLVSRLSGRPLVWSPRGALQRWAGSSRRLEKWAWQRACAIIAPRGTVLHVTSDLEERESLSQLPRLRTAVIPNGVESPSEPKHVPSTGDLRLVYLGRLDPKKGIENLLRACRILLDESRISWLLTIAGDGEAAYRRGLAALAAELGLEERVRMLGYVDADGRARLFERADVVVLPSHSENYGVVVAESLAHGVPVIASTATPWSGLEQHDCGLSVSNEPWSLARAVEKMSAAPRRAMGERGRAWMLRDYRWDFAARAMQTCYAGLIAP